MKNGMVGLMEKDRPAFLFYFKYAEVHRKLPPEESQELLLATIDFAQTGKTPNFKHHNLEYIFPLIKDDLEKDRKKYEEIRKARTKNGQRGGIQKEYNKFLNNENDKKQLHDSIIKHFIKIGGSEIEAKKFIIFNEKNKWTFNGRFKEWQEAAEAWHKLERRENTEKPGSKRHTFTDMALKHNWNYDELEKQMLNLQIEEREDESSEST